MPKIDGAWMKLRQRWFRGAIGVLLVGAVFSSVCPPAVSADSLEQVRAPVELGTGWMLQSSCRVKAGGEKISRAGFRTSGWHLVTVPSTVVAALVADKTFPDPYFGVNLRTIPGTTYPPGQNFSLLAMPKDSPFRCPWWYRTEFRLPADYAGRHLWLHFDGINNRANVWINGRKMAGAKDVAGAYRTYEFEVTAALAASATNVLAVETIAQTENDLGINWVDWNPAPPDKDMGLWRKVYLRASGAVTVRYPYVVTQFPGGSLDRAELTVAAELHNATPAQVRGELHGEIEQINFQQNVVLAPGETRTVRFTPTDFPQLAIAHPRIWWPAQMGAPDLHELVMQFSTAGEASDSQKIRFGIREITSELDRRGHRLFRVNGQKILIRGAGWAPDMLLRESNERLKTEFRYLRDLNLNAIRLEGKMESEEFFDLADEQGVLVMAGWSCCDYWEQWPKWQADDLATATASLRSQVMRLRSHPSLLAWLNGSDNPPPASVEKAYLEVLKDADWANPYLSSASATATTVTGPSGLKMTGPYDYVPPDYWLTADAQYGGAHGFITETSAGPSVPLRGSLRKMLPAGEIAPDSASWNYHAGSLGFKDLSHMEDAMRRIYGAPSGIEDYELKAQAMAYDSERAMFEGYSRNKYEATGIIQWMLNNAWPSLIWHLYDYYLQPAGGYFGAKKACEPLHVQYSYDNRGVDVVNSRYEDVAGLTVTAAVYDIGLQQRFLRHSRVDVGADAAAKALTLPEDVWGGGSPLYFLELKLDNRAGQEVSTNFYWISAKKTVYDWPKTTYRFTPASSYGDLTALQSLGRAESISLSAKTEKSAEGPEVRVKIANRGDGLAFQLHLGIAHKGEEAEIAPALWQDNYIELMPGESREIRAQFLSPEALKGGAELRVTGWNVAPMTLALQPPSSEPQADGKQ